MQRDKERDEAVSLAPLDAEQALRALLAVKPNDDEALERDEAPAE